MIDTNKKPYFENGTTKWYKDEELTEFATQRQNDSTPFLGTVMCFAVTGEGISDYVLIDNKQNILLTSHYGVNHSIDTMKTRITALKVSNNFDRKLEAMKEYKTFNEFCFKYCDRMYNSSFTLDEQCTGYKQLRKMIEEQITPTTFEEILRWENKPTADELLSAPNIKYLRFLHTNLRQPIRDNWNYIKTLEL